MREFDPTPARLESDQMNLAFEHLWRHVRFGVRSLSRARGLTGVAVTALAFAIAVNGIVIAFVDTLLFAKPIGVQDSENVVRVPNSWVLKYDQYADLAHSVTSMALAGQSLPVDVSLGTGSEAQPAEARFVTGNYFPMLGVQPAFGRFFVNAEETARSVDGVVVSYRAWQHYFGGNSSLIGTTIRVGGKQPVVIGVAPKGFTGVDPEPVDFWLLVEPSQLPAGGLWLVGRLRNNTSIASARNELLAVYPSTVPILVDESGKEARLISLVPIYQNFMTRLAGLNIFVISLAGAGAVLLLIACANTSGLLVNRVFHHTRETAIKMHLGAGKAEIIRQLLTEIGLLNAMAGVVAIPLVAWATPLLQWALSAPLRGLRMRPVFPLIDTIDVRQSGQNLLNVRVLATIAAVVCVSSAVSALAPSVYVLRSSLQTWWTAPRWGTKTRRSYLRQGLVVLQVALTVIIVYATTLFTRSFANAAAVHFGMNLENVLVIRPDMRSAQYSEDNVNHLFDDMSDAARTLPQVTHVAVSLTVPIGTGRQYVSAKFPDRLWPWRAGGPVHARPFFDAVSPDYFQLLGIKTVAGTTFGRFDRPGAPSVVVINERVARDAFPGENPIGHCVKFRIEDQCREIVGVVAAVRHHVVRVPGLDDGSVDPAFYVPAEQVTNWNPRYLLIRTATDPGPLIPTLRARLAAIVPSAPYIEIERLTQYRDQQIHGWRVGSILFASIGLLALILATIAVYVVLAFIVRQRTREIGVRLAVGATPRDIALEALLTGVKPVLIGIGLGMLGALSAATIMRALVFGVAATDVLSVAAAALVPLLTGILASFVPAARAAHVDPAVSLRYE